MSHSQTLRYLADNGDAAPFYCPNCDENCWKIDWEFKMKAAIETYHRAAGTSDGEEGADGGGAAAAAEAQG